MGRTRKYKDYLNERLQEPREAVGYLNAALEDEDTRVFLLALRDVADAWGGLGWLAEEGDLNRESVYRMLSSRGNPRLTSLKSVLDAMGLHLSVREDHPKRSSLSRSRKGSARPRA
ncbi:MAG: addiction module antidote protein [Parachlamydiales bacterium]